MDEPWESKVWTVSELTRSLRRLIEGESGFRNFLVRGELSNFKHHPSGHMYFTLKDASSRLRCVMFRSRNSSLRFVPEDGLTVVALGSLGVYEASGDYQLYVDDLHPVGEGELHFAFLQLKKKLETEGLFAAERKRPIPFLPHTVGVVTSLKGAALRDILTVLHRRFPNVDVVLSPAVVQGSSGPASVVRAIELLNRCPGVQVAIVGRGGGSLEELWTFNDESVVRAICRSRIPIVSAVGHETDFTLADLAADRRAPTPSAAAEMVVPDKLGLLKQLSSLRLRLEGGFRRKAAVFRRSLSLLAGSPAFTRPLEPINRRRQEVDENLARALQLAKHGFDRKRRLLGGTAGKLEALSPLATLERGYSVCIVQRTGEIVRKVVQVSPGDAVEVILSDGKIACEVRERAG